MVVPVHVGSVRKFRDPPDTPTLVRLPNTPLHFHVLQIWRSSLRDSLFKKVIQSSTWNSSWKELGAFSFEPYDSSRKKSYHDHKERGVQIYQGFKTTGFNMSKKLTFMDLCGFEWDTVLFSNSDFRESWKIMRETESIKYVVYSSNST